MFSEPVVEVKEEMKSRRCVPHSTKASNPEGLLESQMRSREQMSAGITKKSKKWHLKEIPLETRDAIVKMYLVDNVFQKDVAKYYKVSPMLVSRLVKES